MKFAFFSPKTQFENLGDTLINRELVNLASRECETFLDLSRCPSEFSEEIVVSDNAVNYLNRGFFQLAYVMFKKRLALNECYYLLSPGGYVGELSWRDFLKQIVINIMLVIFFASGVKICWVGCSFERLGVRAKLIYRLRSYLCYSFLVRDHVSLEYLKKNKFKPPMESVDLAFNLPLVSSKVEGNGKIIFSFRVDQHKNQKKLVESIVENILTAERPCQVIFYAQVSRDLEFMTSLCKKMIQSYSNLGFDFSVSQSNSIKECVEQFSDADVVITNRLHVLLIALSKGAIVIPCCYKGENDKIVGLWEQLSNVCVYDMADENVFNICSYAKENSKTVNLFKLNREKLRQDAKFFVFN